MLKSPDKMTLPEVIATLDSGCYLPISTKTNLENRMQFLQHESNTKVFKIEEFMKNMKPITLAPPKLKLQEDFPSIETTTSSTLFPLSSPYSKQIPPDPIEETETIIDYVQLKKIIEYDAALQRIMVWFYDLSRRIYLLDAIRAVHNKRWKLISNQFNYSKLLDDYSYAKEIIDVCDSLNGLNNIDYTHSLLQPYKHLTGLKARTLLTTLITKLDPKIKCDYIISIDKESEINLRGLVYHKIIYYVDDPHVAPFPEYSDVTLKEASLADVERMLNNSNISIPYEYFICLSNPSSYIYLDVYSNFKLINVPPTVKYLSYLPNPLNIDKNTLLKPHLEFVKTYPNISKVRFSQSHLDTWKTDSHIDPALDLSYEEYMDLPLELRDTYTFEQTTWNSFTTDFVFGELLEYDKTNGIIIPKMRDAFMKLAFETTL